MIILQNLQTKKENTERKWKEREFGLIKEKMKKKNLKLTFIHLCGRKEEKRQLYIYKGRLEVKEYIIIYNSNKISRK